MDDLGVPLFSETSMFFLVVWGRGFKKPPTFNGRNLNNNPWKRGNINLSTTYWVPIVRFQGFINLHLSIFVGGSSLMQNVAGKFVRVFSLIISA